MDRRVSFDEIVDSRAMSALLTTRGGAFRDMGDFPAAKKNAKEAMRISPTSFHPYNLMAAVLYEQGRPEEGDRYFAEAIGLGSSLPAQESQVQEILRRSNASIRQKIAEHLYAKDPKKYSWVRNVWENELIESPRV